MNKAEGIKKTFVLHWGEMGSKWGINRTVAQIHALLFLSEKPLHAGELSEQLSIARSNISSGLKELQSWGLIRIVHQLGDRRDHYEAIHDVWQMFRTIALERKRREVDPILRIVEQGLATLDNQTNASEVDQTLQTRLRDLSQLMKLASSFFDKLTMLPPPLVKKLLKFDKKLESIIG